MPALTGEMGIYQQLHSAEIPQIGRGDASPTFAESLCFSFADAAFALLQNHSRTVQFVLSGLKNEDSMVANFSVGALQLEPGAFFEDPVFKSMYAFRVP